MTQVSVGRPARAANILVYSGTQGLSAIGSWMQRTGMGWLAWELTHSPGWVGALALTEVVAAVFISPLAGALADRKSPYRVLLTTQTLMVVQSLAMFTYVLSGHATIWGVLLLALADSVIAAFNTPVRMTVIHLVAPRDRLSQAIASNSLFFNMARVIGPAASGAIMAAGAVAPVFAVNAASYLIFMAAVVYLKPWIDRPVSAAQTQGRIGGDIVAGFRYISTTPQITTLFLLAAVFSLLARPFTELFPAINGEMFHGGPVSLSALMSAQGVGALLGAALMLRRRGTRRVLFIAFAGGLALPAIMIGFAFIPSLHLAVPIIAIAGLAHVVCNISMQSLTQMFAEDAYRGRTMALYATLFRSLPALGAFLIGLAAEGWGLRGLLGGVAALGLILTAALAVQARKIYRSAVEPA